MLQLFLIFIFLKWNAVSEMNYYIYVSQHLSLIVMNGTVLS